MTDQKPFDQYSMDDQLLAVMAIVMFPSIDWEVPLYDIPPEVVSAWREQHPDAWQHMVSICLAALATPPTAAQQEQRETIRDKCLARLRDSLLHGDYKLDDATGEVVRVPLEPEAVARILREVGEDVGFQLGIANKH